MEDDGYKKDIDNELNIYEGTWGYSQGNTEVTIHFEKLMDYNPWAKYYHDVVDGNYRWVENGSIIYDSLNVPIEEAEISDSNTSFEPSNITGNFYDEEYTWNSDNPMGAIISIDITPDSGSVICSDYDHRRIGLSKYPPQ